MSIFCINSICRGSKSVIRDSYCSKDNIDILFYNIPSNLPLDTNSVNILFGCDETKLIPKKNNDILEVLIDHSYYNEGNENSDIEYSSKILNKTSEGSINRYLLSSFSIKLLYVYTLL